MEETDEIEMKAPKVEEDVTNLTKEQQVLITKELLRKTPEYKVCWELELWKKQEKQKFEIWIEKTKKEKISNFEKESKKKEAKMQKIFQNRQKEMEGLEKELRESIKSVEERESQVKYFEKELRRRKVELESDFKRKIKDLEQSNQLVREECAHKVNLISSTLIEKESNLKKQKLKFEEKERKYNKLQDDYNELQKKYINTDHIRLSNENNDLKKRIEECEVSKKTYKVQFRKAQKLLNVIKKKHDQRTQKLLDKILNLQQSYNANTLMSFQNQHHNNSYVPRAPLSSNGTPRKLGVVRLKSEEVTPSKIDVIGGVNKGDKTLEEIERELYNIKTEFTKIKGNDELEIKEEEVEEVEDVKSVRKKERNKTPKKKQRKTPKKTQPNVSTDSTENMITSFEQNDFMQMGSPQRGTRFVKGSKKRKVKKKTEGRKKKRGGKKKGVKKNESRVDINDITPIESENEDEMSAKVRLEIRELTKQKAILLQSGNYKEEDELIKSIDKRLSELVTF